MADEASDEVRERIRADLRRAGLLPESLMQERPRGPARRDVAGFLLGMLAPALAIVGFAAALVAFGPG